MSDSDVKSMDMSYKCSKYYIYCQVTETWKAEYYFRIVFESLSIVVSRGTQNEIFLYASIKKVRQYWQFLCRH